MSKAIRESIDLEEPLLTPETFMSVTKNYRFAKLPEKEITFHEQVRETLQRGSLDFREIDNGKSAQDRLKERKVEALEGIAAMLKK